MWQSLHVATAWWLPWSQPSYCGCMMWQLAQDSDRVLKYENARPSTSVNIDSPKNRARLKAAASGQLQRRRGGERPPAHHYHQPAGGCQSAPWLG
jgi:hypothetical protein